MNAIRKTNAIAALASLLLLSPGAIAKPQQVASGATAQPASLTVGNKMYDAGKELARLTKRYGLTEEQRTKIQPILADQQKQVHVLGEDQSLSDSEWAAEVRKVHLQAVANVKRQLTDAQAARYAKDEAKRSKGSGSSDDGDDGPPDGPPPDGGPGGGPGGGGPPPGE